MGTCGRILQDDWPRVGGRGEQDGKARVWVVVRCDVISVGRWRIGGYAEAGEFGCFGLLSISRSGEDKNQDVAVGRQVKKL